MTTPLKTAVHRVLAEAGIGTEGREPYDLEIRDERFYGRFLRDGTLGLGESYMDGWWECARIDEMMTRFSRARLSSKFKRDPQFLYAKFRARFQNEGDKANALKGVQHHYDIGNDLYQLMLDERMVYTCAYWKDATTLLQAQENKLELVCQKLQLEPGMKVLDIGCGWGSFAKYAAERYGVEVVGVSISEEQLALGREICKGLPVELRFSDYRDVAGRFDRVVSIGMFEHVCHRNHRAFMEVVHRNLTSDGICLLHTMGRHKSVVRGNDLWITKYIFPNTQVPSIEQIGRATDDLLHLEDWESFGPYYDRTLMAWHANFEQNWPKLRAKYGDRFYRMWRYYLQIFAGWFRSRALHLWQVVLSKNGLPGGYAFQQNRTRIELGGDGHAPAV